MAAPTFVSETETVWNNKTKPKTVSMTTADNDVVVVLFALEEYMMTTATDPSVSGTLSWSQYENAGSNSRGRVGIWGAAGIDAAGWTLTGTHGGDTSVLDKWWGFDALRFSGATLVGAAAESRSDAGSTGIAGTIGITTTSDNSAIAVIISEWSASSYISRTWASPQAGAGTELFYQQVNSAHYTVFVGYYADAGAAGAKTVGITQTIGGHSIAAIEIKSGTVTPPPAGLRVFPSTIPYQLGMVPPPSVGVDPKRSSMLLNFF